MEHFRGFSTYICIKMLHWGKKRKNPGFMRVWRAFRLAFGQAPHLPENQESEPERINFRITNDDLGAGGPKEKFRANLEAIALLKNLEAAQKLSDRINPEDLHKVLDAFAKRYCPVPETLGLSYIWTIQQIECATDVMFKQPGDLEPLYDEIIRTAIFTVKPDNIATFLGQRITYNCKKEVGTNYNQRILGTRIKHHMQYSQKGA